MLLAVHNLNIFARFVEFGLCCAADMTVPCEQRLQFHDWYQTLAGGVRSISGLFWKICNGNVLFCHNHPPFFGARQWFFDSEFYFPGRLHHGQHFG